MHASAGGYAVVNVGIGGKLRLNAGVYEVTSLTMSTGARLEALRPVELRIQGRMSASTSIFIGAASGVTLSARDLRIEVSGINGTTGALTATPPAATVGTGAVIKALVFVPNGSLVVGTGANATGAFMARDLDIGGAGASFTFQDGFDCVPTRVVPHAGGASVLLVSRGWCTRVVPVFCWCRRQPMARMRWTI